MKKVYPFFMLAVFILMAFTLQSHLAMMMHWVQGVGFVAPLLFVALYCVSSLFFIPTAPFVLAGGALFGPIWGTLLSLLSATLGAVSAFLITRYKGTDWLSSNRVSRIHHVLEQTKYQGWKSVAMFRLTPAPFSLVNYGFGLTHITLRHYALATFFFLMPYKVAVTYFGYLGGLHV
jgi:uncharacterized membrane protein YdjX (TVP38/TMEM64 family)